VRGKKLFDVLNCKGMNHSIKLRVEDMKKLIDGATLNQIPKLIDAATLNQIISSMLQPSITYLNPQLQTRNSNLNHTNTLTRTLYLSLSRTGAGNQLKNLQQNAAIISTTQLENIFRNIDRSPDP
jgi:hypothetical protein